MRAVPLTAVLAFVLASGAPGGAQPCTNAPAAVTHAVRLVVIGRQPAAPTSIAVDVNVAAHGTVTDAHVTDERDEDGLAAIAAARASTFRPARLDCHPAADVVHVLVPVDLDEGPAVGRAIVAEGRGTILHPANGYLMRAYVTTEITDPLHVVAALADEVAALAVRLAPLGVPRTAIVAGPVTRNESAPSPGIVPMSRHVSQQEVMVTIPAAIDPSAALAAATDTNMTRIVGIFIARDPQTSAAAIGAAVADAADRARAVTTALRLPPPRIDRITVIASQLRIQNVLLSPASVEREPPTDASPALVPVSAEVRVTFGLESRP
jgi:hypothetical protein